MKNVRLLLCCLLPHAAGAAVVGQWDFNGSLASSTGGSNLVAAAAAPATAPGVTFTTASIAGQTAQAAEKGS